MAKEISKNKDVFPGQIIRTMKGDIARVQAEGPQKEKERLEKLRVEEEKKAEEERKKVQAQKQAEEERKAGEEKQRIEAEKRQKEEFERKRRRHTRS